MNDKEYTEIHGFTKSRGPSYDTGYNCYPDCYTAFQLMCCLCVIRKLQKDLIHEWRLGDVMVGLEKSVQTQDRRAKGMWNWVGSDWKS